MAPPRLLRPALALLLIVGCSSAGSGQNVVPGTSSGGPGGVIGTVPGAGGSGGPGGSSGSDGGPVIGGAGGTGGIVVGHDAGADAPTMGGDGPVGSVPVGGKCATNAMCGPDGLCAADVAGGGYCTADCTTTNLCPTGASCYLATDTTKICLKTCGKDGDCRAEHLCLQGYCVPKCTADSDCSSGNCVVASGQCGPSRVGNGCAADSDCGQYPAFCDKTRPEGYCSLPCGGSNNVSCPDGANCVSAGSAGACLKACASAADCGSNLLCASNGSGVGACVPRCRADGDCAPGLRCDLASGGCVPGGPAQGTLGGPCAVDADCSAIGVQAYCATSADGFPGGYCSIPCPSLSCPMNGACVSTSATEQDCLSSCQTPADCRDGYTCFALTTGSQQVCFPKCTSDTDCQDPQPVCDLDSGYCAARPVGGGTTSGNVVDLTPNGPVSLTDTALSGRFIVTVPADAVSIDFIGQAVSDPTALMAVYRLEQSTNDFASSTRLFDRGSITNQVQVPPPVVPGAFSVLYPNSPSAPFLVSSATTTVKLAIQVQVSQPTTVKLTALIKHASSRALSSGNIDLNLFFVGVPRLDATSAQTDPYFKQILDRVKATWAKAGVGIGNVRYIDLGAADASRFSDLSEPDLGELMTRSLNPAAADDAMNVFFVHSISGDTIGGYIILGESAGVPGVPIRGTTASGLAVTTADFPAGAADIADTWAHEGGHFLGLFHTTELGGTAFDPLPDTPECPRVPYDTNGDKILEPAECQARDAPNEMFWTKSAAFAHDLLTPNQGFVMLRSPSVH